MEKSIIKLLVFIIWLLFFIIYVLNIKIIDNLEKIKTDTGRNYKNILKLNK